MRSGPRVRQAFATTSVTYRATRPTAGCAHVSCLAEQAKILNEEANEKRESRAPRCPELGSLQKLEGDARPRHAAEGCVNNSRQITS